MTASRCVPSGTWANVYVPSDPVTAVWFTPPTLNRSRLTTDAAMPGSSASRLPFAFRSAKMVPLSLPVGCRPTFSPVTAVPATGTVRTTPSPVGTVLAVGVTVTVWEPSATFANVYAPVASVWTVAAAVVAVRSS